MAYSYRPDRYCSWLPVWSWTHYIWNRRLHSLHDTRLLPEQNGSDTHITAHDILHQYPPDKRNGSHQIIPLSQNILFCRLQRHHMPQRYDLPSRTTPELCPFLWQKPIQAHSSNHLHHPASSYHEVISAWRWQRKSVHPFLLPFPAHEWMPCQLSYHYSIILHKVLYLPVFPDSQLHWIRYLFHCRSASPVEISPAQTPCCHPWKHCPP